MYIYDPYEDPGGQEFDQEDVQDAAELAADLQNDVLDAIPTLGYMPEPYISDNEEN